HSLPDDDGVVEPGDDVAGIAPLHSRPDEVSAGLLQRRAYGDLAVVMVRGGLKIEIPAGDEPPEILFLVLRDNARANVADIDLLPVELRPMRGDVILDIGEKLGNQDLVGLELDAATVAKAEVERCPTPRRLGHDGLKLTPGAFDLGQMLALPAVRIAIRGLALLEVLGRSLELAAVLENGRELAECLFSVAG